MLVLTSQVGVVMVGGAWIMFKNKRKVLVKSLGKRAMGLALIVAAGASLGSLFFSEVMGLVPCQLCWYQRILMYPQVIMLGVALKQKRKYSWESVIAASIGAMTSAYHYLLQRSAVPNYFCNAVGYSESCSNVFEMTYGYITIPLMALTAFVMIIGFNYLGWRESTRKI